MKTIQLICFLCSCLFFSFTAYTQTNRIYIPVGAAKIKKSRIAFAETKLSAPNPAATSTASKIKEMITKDLQFMNLFEFQPSAAFIEKSGAGITFDTFRISDWTTIGTEFLIKTSLEPNGPNLTYEVRLYDVLGTKQILGKRYVARSEEWNVVAHSASNDIVQTLTGRPGIFFTKIAMSCDGGRKNKVREIYVMNYDGSNPRQITNPVSIAGLGRASMDHAFQPAWSPDNRKIVYSRYAKNKKNVINLNLYEYHFSNRTSYLLSNQNGMNLGGTYSPDGRSLAVVMSFQNTPNIYLLNPITKMASQLTQSLGFNIDPHFSPDGKKLAFISVRHGPPTVYTADLEQLKNNHGAGTRIAMAGNLNATPRWAPQGDQIVFAGQNNLRSKKNFDLFLIKTDGSSKLDRLTGGATVDEGDNRDPDWSPDGNFIVFSSERSSQEKNIYIMNSDGSNPTRLTFGLGNCSEPRWSALSQRPF